jgi:predicted RNA-binding Zn-ribbon protein involved in translation (DUF1610 family)
LSAASDPPEALAPSCDGCGAPLPVELLAESIRCASCASIVRIDAALRAHMRAYVSASRRAQIGELVARRMAVLHSQNERATGITLYGTLGVALAGAGWLLLLVSGAARAVPLAGLGALMIVTFAALAALARGFTIMLEPPTLARLMAMKAARCNGCGAFVAFEAGRPTLKCRHCGGTALVPSELAWSLLREVQSQEAGALCRAHDAELASVERAHAASASIGIDMRRGSTWRFTAVLLLGSTLAVVGVVALAAGGAGSTPTWWVLPALLLGLGAAVAWVVRVVRRAMGAVERLEQELGVKLVMGGGYRDTSAPR